MCQQGRRYAAGVRSLDERISAADALLAPFAVKHGSGLSRAHPEQEASTRFRFQRDRGRIVHTEAFRRLKSKTQVFVGGGGDHYRTRLTHTLEVAGISRDIARALSLNEDLAECIGLAHDLGHPPFGHAGEMTINQWIAEFDKKFEHNIQSHRIVTVLERHSSLCQGLNLNIEILEGLLKHSTPHDHPGEVLVKRSPSLEAQVVNLADEITYSAHDSEDGLEAGLFDRSDITDTALAAEAYAMAAKRGTSLRGAIIDLLVRDLYENLKASSLYQSIITLEQVYSLKDPVIVFSDNMRAQLNELRAFLASRMYDHPFVREHTRAGQQIVLQLCRHYCDEPGPKIMRKMEELGCPKEDAIKDYVSGMTDGYAYLQADSFGLISEDVSEVLGQSDS